MADKKAAPIIKKIKKVAGGHHGGAWKIAYADFVTAMMAFFLLLWLLNSTPSKTLQGIADYFSPTIGIKDEKGIGFYGGKVPLDDGQSSSDMGQKPSIKYGVPYSGPKVDAPKDNQKESEEDGSVESARMQKIEEELKEQISNSQELSQYQDNIVVTMTNEGLKIEVVDKGNVSMFKIGSAELQPHAKLILDSIAGVIKDVPNFISISGHTDGRPYGQSAAYTNWELSADRANSSRRHLVSKGIKDDKIARVVGRAAKELKVPEDPNAEVNRRISIVLLHKSIMPYQEKSAPEAFFKNKEVDERLLTTKTKDAQKTVEPEKTQEIRQPEKPKANIPADQVGDPFQKQPDAIAPQMNIP